MKTSTLIPTTPLRVMALTVLLALGATAAQTARAQPQAQDGAHSSAHHGAHHGGKHHDKRGGYRGGEGHGMGSPRMMGRMLDAVNATPEQRAQIKQITDAARADMKAQREAGRKLREDSAALFTQPTVDARAAEALRQQMLAQHDQASQRRLQMMLEISRVLTPEQRKTLADKMAQRRAMMERHRAERAAVEPQAR